MIAPDGMAPRVLESDGGSQIGIRRVQYHGRIGARREHHEQRNPDTLTIYLHGCHTQPTCPTGSIFYLVFMRITERDQAGAS